MQYFLERELITIKTKTRDIITSAILCLVSIVGLVLTLQIPDPFREYDLGARFLPQLILGLILGLSILKIVTVLIENEDGTVEKKDASQYLKGLCTIALVGLYCFCYEVLGFIVDTSLYLFLQIFILTPKGKRKIWKIIVVDLIATITVYLIFREGFSVQLPEGVLTFL